MDTLQEEMDEILELVFTAQECFKIYDYLSGEFDDVDKHVVVYHGTFFMFVRGAMFDQIILAFSKLLIPQERFNLRTFINKFRDGGEYGSLGIEQSKIKEWQQEIKTLDRTIQEIISVRNAAVAHKDSNAPAHTLLTKADLRVLVNTVQNIFKDINLIVYKRGFMIEQPIGEPVQSLEHIVNELTQKKKSDLASLRALGRAYGL